MTNTTAKPVTVALPTLGCKANRYDSDTLARALIQRGYAIVPAHTPADVYIVNTCTVTGEADAKSRKTLRKALRLREDAVLIVTGCYASSAPERLWAIDGVDAVVPIAEQAGIPDLVMRLRPPIVGDTQAPSLPHSLSASVDRTRATVKIQDGCNLRCAYCAVSRARGPLRSRPLDEVIAELQQLAARGIPEVVLTGIRLDAYGLDLPNTQLSDLLDATHDLAVARLRFSSLEPMGISPHLITRMAAHPLLCHHFHICLQSGDDGILHAMRRGYTVADYRDLISRIRTEMPDATFSTDIVVGFPGESDVAFQHTCDVIEELRFFKLHIFKFSPRPQTPAQNMPAQVSDEVKEQRSGQLLMLEQRLFSSCAKDMIGNIVPVLVELSGKDGDGLTAGYFRVSSQFLHKDKGNIVQVLITDHRRNSLIGTAIKPNV